MTKESYVFQKVISDISPLVVDAKGLELTIVDPNTGAKRTVIDAMTGAAVGSLGHQDDEIIDVMCQAARKNNYSFGLYLGNQASEDLARYICDERSPKGHFSSALWVGSGSEANENAMKIAKQYHSEKGDTKRYKFISRVNSYHGFTIGALSLGDGIRKKDFKSILLSEEQTPKISAANVYRFVNESKSEEEYTQDLLQEMEESFIKNDPSTICAVFLETVGGSSFGTVPPPKGYLDGVKAICEKYGALLVLDEVMVGLGRSGKFNCYECFMEGQPDLLTVGKTIGSGYVTLAGVIISPKVKDAVTSGSNATAGAQTYHCHGFNCEVGLAVQKKLARDNLIEKGAAVGRNMMEQLALKLKDSKLVGDIRGLPLFFSVEFCDPVTKAPLDPNYKFAYKLGDKCLENGITTMGLQGTAGSIPGPDGPVAAGDHLSLAPPYIITQEQGDFIVDALVKSIKEVEEEYFKSN